MTIDSPTKFLEKIHGKLESVSIDLKHWEIDHLCYRTNSEADYLHTKSYFQERGTLLVESEVGGRLIATYKLHEPVPYKGYLIDLVEVPAPKKGRAPQQGYEHIEVVIDCSFEDLIKSNPSVNFKTKAMAKELNPEIEVEFEDCAVKFHHKSLEQVIHIEKNALVIDFLQSSNLFQALKEFSPCLSGSIPLNLQTTTSDLDVLFTCDELSFFEKVLCDNFQQYDNFQMKRATHQNTIASVTTFKYQKLSVEFFCSSLEVHKQQANQHLLIEGRLLKVGGAGFLKEIKILKERGVKTEPAFGEVLGLKEPYQQLLELRSLSDQELKTQFFS